MGRSDEVQVVGSSLGEVFVCFRESFVSTDQD